MLLPEPASQVVVKVEELVMNWVVGHLVGHFLFAGIFVVDDNILCLSVHGHTHVTLVHGHTGP